MPLRMFFLDKRRPDGFSTWCRSCNRLSGANIRIRAGAVAGTTLKAAVEEWQRTRAAVRQDGPFLERARLLVEASVGAMFDRIGTLGKVVADPGQKFAADWRALAMERHVDEVLDLLGRVREDHGSRRSPVRESFWQRCTVRAAGLPYSGQTFWVRGRPVYQSGLGRDVWTGRPVRLDKPKRYVESNLWFEGRAVWVEHEMIERMNDRENDIRAYVPHRQLEPATGSLPAELEQGETA